MADFSGYLRVSNETRRRLKAFSSGAECSYNDAIMLLLATAMESTAKTEYEAGVLLAGAHECERVS